ncbi:MAG: S-adenosyl-l-methionine hydroxide adenosyltransferase family protein [Dehalococcoidia bacterium]
MPAAITFTTDFGLRDAYVAAMKGVVLGINPEATLVDISHSVAPQNVREGAFVLGMAYRYFPQGTIHVAVVDPGVGTSRRGLILKGAGHYFVAPDNGVLSHVLTDALEEGPSASKPAAEAQDLPPGFEAVVLTERRYWRPDVSDTFHGRDIFAPVAAHLSLGVPLKRFGEPLSSVLAFPRPTPTVGEDGSVRGEIMHIDGFGNLITNIRRGNLPEGDVEISMTGHSVRGISRSYQEGKGLLAIFGSGGYLEISESNGSAASITGAGVGASVVVRSLSD